MDSPHGQTPRSRTRGRRSEDTRRRLLRAAAELVAEVGWGRVTTRAVAERAGLPHGTVSYHFPGKGDLLTEAALSTFEDAFPLDQFEQLGSVDELLRMVAAELGDPEALDPVLQGVSMEAMREAERDPRVRRRMAALMRDYRKLIARLVRADQKGGDVRSKVSASGLATLVGAVGDGLLLHGLLDPELDTREAIRVLRALVSP